MYRIKFLSFLPLFIVNTHLKFKCLLSWDHMLPGHALQLSHPQLFSQVSLRRIKTLFGPTAQRQNRRWKYLFVSKALAIPAWKAHLGWNLQQPELLPWLPLPPGSRPLAQVLVQEVPLGRKSGIPVPTETESIKWELSPIGIREP